MFVKQQTGIWQTFLVTVGWDFDLFILVAANGRNRNKGWSKRSDQQKKGGTNLHSQEVLKNGAKNKVSVQLSAYMLWCIINIFPHHSWVTAHTSSELPSDLNSDFKMFSSDQRDSANIP